MKKAANPIGGSDGKVCTLNRVCDYLYSTTHGSSRIESSLPAARITNSDRVPCNGWGAHVAASTKAGVSQRESLETFSLKVSLASDRIYPPLHTECGLTADLRENITGCVIATDHSGCDAILEFGG